MPDTINDRHKAENEAIFRGLNQRVQRGVHTSNAMTSETGAVSLRFDDKDPLDFFCECADENCQERIQMSLEEYTEIHKDKRRFIIVPGHDVSEIENVTTKKSSYWVVTKYEVPPENSSTLHPTDVHNT